MEATHIFCDMCDTTMPIQYEPWLQDDENKAKKWKDLCCECGYIIATISIIKPRERD